MKFVTILTAVSALEHRESHDGGGAVWVATIY